VHSWNLNDAMRAIAAAEAGVIVLLHRSETGDALLERLQAKLGSGPSAKMDLRTYGIGAQILKDLGVTRMKVMAVPRKMPSMAGFDLEVTGYLLPERNRPQGTVASINDRKR
jgi:3,4-dihydroxy 2-butanone 4-phosphate synthase/GTP cyclohydrolase II